MSRRTKKVLELSLHEAMALGHKHIGPEDILLGLLAPATPNTNDQQATDVYVHGRGM